MNDMGFALLQINEVTLSDLIFALQRVHERLESDEFAKLTIDLNEYSVTAETMPKEAMVIKERF